MTWFRVGGAGIPASLKNAMNAVFNKKFGTSGQNYPPKQWPDDVNLLGPLPEGTATGSVANFSDGADRVPTKNVIATIAPNIDGVSSVAVVHTGANLLFNNIEDGTTGGIGYTKQSDGSIACSGTVSNVNETRLINTVVLPIGNYVLSGADSSINLRAVLYDSEGAVITNRNDTGSGVTISVDNTVSHIEVRIKARTNAEQVNTTISPMLAVGSTPQTYEKYNGTTHTANFGRTIYGGTADLVSGEGSETWEKKVYTGADNEYWVLSKSGDIYRYYVINDNVKQPTGRGVVYSSIGQYSATGNDVGTCFTYYSSGIQRTLIYYIPPQTIQTVEDFRTWLSSNNFDVVYEKATPVDFTFDSQEMNSLYGVNNFWNDAGGDTTIVYRRDIDLALQAVSSSRGLMMASRPVTQLVGEESDPDQVNELVENDETEQEGEDNAR